MFHPANLVGQPLSQALKDLVRVPGEELWPQGEVELYNVGALDPVTGRPASMMVTTMADMELPMDHPEVTIPGVSLEQFLGGGGQGWVYAGRVEATGKIVAVKVLRSEYVVAQGWAAREALVCARVRHPNILRVFETQAVGQFWVVLMEMIPGADLAAVRLSLDELRPAFVQIADALRTLGKMQIVHCDVKPANILVRQSGAPVLVDFGIACDLTQPQEIKALFGTPYFLAPEAFRLLQPNPAWDAYALGVTGASALGFHRAYESLGTLQDHKLSGTFERSLAQALEGLSDGNLRSWILDLLHAEPRRRLAALEETATRLAV